MEKTYKRVPFNIELAKKIQSGEVEGRIITRNRSEARILAFDIRNISPIIAAVLYDEKEYIYFYSEDGKYVLNDESRYDLFIEFPEESPEEQHPKEESELYQAGYKVGFEAGRCVAFDERKGCTIKEETPKHDFIVGESVKIISGLYSGRRGK